MIKLYQKKGSDRPPKSIAALLEQLLSHLSSPSVLKLKLLHVELEVYGSGLVLLGMVGMFTLLALALRGAAH
jgi:hypothetical protein